jgi:hypothetical protein
MRANLSPPDRHVCASETAPMISESRGSGKVCALGTNAPRWRNHVTALVVCHGRWGLRGDFRADFGPTRDPTPDEEALRSVLRPRLPVSCRAGVSGAGGSPWALRSPTLRSICFRPSRRRLCLRFSLKLTPQRSFAQLRAVARPSLHCTRRKLCLSIAKLRLQ